MTDSTTSRGPDFLPYPLPVLPAPQEAALAPPTDPRGRWQAALNGLTPWGVAAVTAGGFALLALVVVSLLAGQRHAGAALACVAAFVGLVAGFRAIPQEQPADSVVLVKTGMGTGVAAALVALLLLLTHHSSVADQPPVRVPQPQPTASASPDAGQPTPSPSASPEGGPELGVPNVPSQPGSPVSQDPVAKGLLKGRVITTSGAAVPGATVTITRADKADVSSNPPCPLTTVVMTDANGDYSVPLCQLGDNLGYQVVIRSGTASSGAILYVNSGRTTVYNVILAIRRA